MTKPQTTTQTPKSDDLMKARIEADDASNVRQLLEKYPALRNRVNDPIGPFDSPALNSARSREMIDALLDAGADVNGKSQWWAGGFGLLHSVGPELAAYAIERGAQVDIHAACRLGLFDRVRELIELDPQLVRARGGDGQTPLHFAKTTEIAAYLLDQGADIDVKDIDHESTPAQWMLGDRPLVARFLVDRGCQTDILLASAVGHLDQVRALLAARPECVRVRVNAQFFPMENKKAGGIIYQWTLGPNASPFQAAAKFGHQDVIRLLMDRSPVQERLIALCWMHDGPAIADLVAQDPDLAGRLSEADRNEIASAARNNDTEAVRLMLEAGLPVTAKGQHRGTPLHWAAWHGNLAMVESDPACRTARRSRTMQITISTEHRSAGQLMLLSSVGIATRAITPVWQRPCSPQARRYSKQPGAPSQSRTCSAATERKIKNSRKQPSSAHRPFGASVLGKNPDSGTTASCLSLSRLRGPMAARASPKTPSPNPRAWPSPRSAWPPSSSPPPSSDPLSSSSSHTPRAPSIADQHSLQFLGLLQRQPVRLQKPNHQPPSHRCHTNNRRAIAGPRRCCHCSNCRPHPVRNLKKPAKRNRQ